MYTILPLNIFFAEMPRIPVHRRHQLIEELRKGTSQRQAAALYGVSHTAVQKLAKKHALGFGVEDRPKTGRKCKLSARHQRRICRISKLHPKMTAREIQGECNLTYVASVETVKRVLRSAKLFGRIAAKKPRLTRQHKLRRKSWCVSHRNNNVQDWRKIIYSDECRLELHPRRREFVRRPPNKRYESKYCTET